MAVVTKILSPQTTGLNHATPGILALQRKFLSGPHSAGKGDPATMIVDEAEHEGADVIVMGTRGLNTAKRWLMGSVSSRVVQHAPCNVLVVR